MLRVVLGIGGVSLIAVGLFGGQFLDSMHRSVSDTLTTDNVIADNSPVLDQAASGVALQETAKTAPVVQPAAAKPALVDASAVVDSVTKTQAATVTETVAALNQQSEPVVEDTPEVVAAVLNKDSATGAVQSPVATIQTGTIDDADYIKSEGVEIVLASTTGAPTSNTLFVQKERVNLREGPSTRHPVVLELDIGQELMEFKRDGRWIHVGAYGTSGKIGWVHSTLVGTR